MDTEEMESCDRSRKKCRWVSTRRCMSASFCGWEALLHQSTVKTECTPERLQKMRKKRTLEKVYEKKKSSENTVPAETRLRKIRNGKKEKNKIKTEEQKQKR